MKLTADILRDFLTNLAAYDSLSLTDRRALASIERPSQSCSTFVLRDSLNSLIAAAFLRPPLPNGRCPVEPSRQEFIRTLRVLRRHPVFYTPARETFDGYVNEHLAADERETLRSDDNPYRTEKCLALYQQVTSPDWLEGFLTAKDAQWELKYQTRGAAALFARPEVWSSARNIVKWLMAHGGRAILRDLPALAPDPELLSAAVHAAMRYALLYVAIEPDTMEAVLGVWPSIMADPAIAGIPPPCNVLPAETCAPLYLVEDMTVVLMECAAEPLALKADDRKLYTKSARKLADALRPLPEWVDQTFHTNTDYRVSMAVRFVRIFQLTEEGGHPHPQRLTVSEQGREWLGRSFGERLRVLMGWILQHPSVGAIRSLAGHWLGITGSQLQVHTYMKPAPDIPAAVMQPFRSLDGDGFFPLREILAFSQMTNPLLMVYRKDKNAYYSSDSRYLHGPDAPQLQEAWSETLQTFLRLRLLPLGGLRVGHGKEGVSIAITPVGRYYLGQLKEWQEPESTDSQVIVQPNFEVTFLGEAPAVAAEIGRFAERRRGQRVGALFQITKKSIFAAAALDMTAEGVMEVLERVCTREVPGNVRREIQGWFAQCRKVSMESTMLIRCPDRETALRVKSLANGAATALSDTILEYKDPGGKHRPALIRKLKEMGVLISVHDAEPPEKRWPW
jgi:hypothetical protein